MKMPWHSMYHDAEGGTPPSRRRYQPPSGLHYSSPRYYPTSSGSSSSTRRPYQTPHYEPSSSSRQRNVVSPLRSSEYGTSNPFRMHRRAMDAATERLLARADALTERLHRLLAKSAEIHFCSSSASSSSSSSGGSSSGRGGYSGRVPRPDIFSSSRMSHHPMAAAATAKPTTASQPPPPPNRTTDDSRPTLHRQPDVRQHYSAATDPVSPVATTPAGSNSSNSTTPRIHVINIKLSNSCFTAHHPKQSHQTYRRTGSTGHNKTASAPAPAEDPASSSSSKESTPPPAPPPEPKRRTPIVRIIPIRVETGRSPPDSSDAHLASVC